MISYPSESVNQFLTHWELEISPNITGLSVLTYPIPYEVHKTKILCMSIYLFQQSVVLIMFWYESMKQNDYKKAMKHSS